MSEEKEEKSQEEQPKRKLKWVPRWVSLPFIIIIIFVTVVLFFDDNSYLKNMEYSQRITDLKIEIKENLDSAKYYSQKARALNTDPESLEKISREQYHMQRQNEDVYITNIK